MSIISSSILEDFEGVFCQEYNYCVAITIHVMYWHYMSSKWQRFTISVNCEKTRQWDGYYIKTIYKTHNDSTVSHQAMYYHCYNNHHHTDRITMVYIRHCDIHYLIISY